MNEVERATPNASDWAELEREYNWLKAGGEAANKGIFQCPAPFWANRGQYRRWWTYGLVERYEELNDRKSWIKAKMMQKRAQVYLSLPELHRSIISYIMCKLHNKRTDIF